jgi:O-antigen/teichoic acid export membrane protein
MTGVAFTRSLTVSDRGYFALLTLFPAILFQVIALGAPSAVAFFGANEDGARHARGHSILKLVGLQALACLAVHVVLLLAYLPHAPTSIYPAALLSLVISPLALAIEYGIAALQATRRYDLVSICRPISTIASAPAALAAWALFPGDLLDAVGAITFGLALGCAVTAYLGVSSYASLLSGRATRGTSISKILSYGIRSYVASLYPIDAFRIDQLLLAAWTTPASLATYAVASSFTNFPRFLAQSVGYVALPLVAASQFAQRGRVQLRIVLAVAGPILLLSVPIFVLMPALVELFFGSAYRSAAEPGRLLLLAAILLAVRRIAVEALKGSARMGLAIAAEIATWVVLGLVSRGLVTTSGINGMALSLVTAYFVGILVIVALNQIMPAKSHDRSDSSL